MSARNRNTVGRLRRVVRPRLTRLLQYLGSELLESSCKFFQAVRQVSIVRRFVCQGHRVRFDSALVFSNPFGVLSHTTRLFQDVRSMIRRVNLADFHFFGCVRHALDLGAENWIASTAAGNK